MATPATHPRAATHYEVLNLAPSLIDSQTNPTQLIKRAYHRALLRNHPDKATSSQPPSSQSPPSQPSAFTVDQITAAFNTLSSPASRRAYDTVLRISRPRGASTRDANFQTGVENVDLDDLAFDEKDQCWYRPCRCGNERGYLFREADLEEAGDEGELIVGCLDCSLWLRVHFAVVQDEGPEDANNNDKS